MQRPSSATFTSAAYTAPAYSRPQQQYIPFAGKKSRSPKAPASPEIVITGQIPADFKQGFFHRKIQTWLRQFWERGLYRHNPELASAILQRFQQLRHPDFSHSDFVTSAREILAPEVLAKKAHSPDIASGKQLLLANRAVLRTGEILQLLDQFAPGQFPPDWGSGVANTANMRYLDIGCGDADITQKLTESLGLNPRHVMGLEIASAEITAKEKREESASGSSVPIHYYDGVTFPVKDASQDLVSSLMVLHHVQNPEAMMDEMVRVLKPGGLLLVREVDGSDPSVFIFNRLVDSFFYDVMENDPSKQSMPCQYRSINDWAHSFQTRGLELLTKRRFTTNPAFEPPNFTQATYLLLRKPESPLNRAD
ncbi:MAG: class I SAM-dependent methyltransferase [Cyanobacteria bacterium]|nr:class I SAM-dependent methyltransferase [Cyanobacteriota bacterium]